VDNPEVARDEEPKGEVFHRFAAIVAESLHIDVEQVTPDSYLGDLGAESLDMVEIAIHAEDKFNISLPEKNILQTAIEVFGPDVLEKDGILTDIGKAMLRRRMPEISPMLQQPTVTVKDINQLFTRVDMWVCLIKRLMEFTPKVCPQCNAALKTAVAMQMRCKQCGAETPVPNGEELNRQWLQEYYEKEYPSLRVSSLGDESTNDSPNATIG
jgi:acyl carrier protein